jgi:hypothetical protein
MSQRIKTDRKVKPGSCLKRIIYNIPVQPGTGLAGLGKTTNY